MPGGFAASAFSVPLLKSCDLNHRLAISEASVSRSSAFNSCKSEPRQSAPLDIWSIGWPEAQSRKHPLTDWNLNAQDRCFYKDFRNLRLAIVAKNREIRKQRVHVIAKSGIGFRAGSLAGGCRGGGSGQSGQGPAAIRPAAG